MESARLASANALTREIWTLICRSSGERGFIGLVGLAALSALFEVAGVFSIVPFLSLLLDPGIADRNSVLRLLKETLNITQENLPMAMAIFTVCMFQLSMAISLTCTHYFNSYSQERRLKLAQIVFQGLMRKRYHEFQEQSTSQYINAIFNESSRVANGVIFPFLTIVARSIVSFLLGATVIIVGGWAPAITMTIAFLMALILYKRLRRIIGSSGLRSSTCYSQAHQLLTDTLANVKVVKVWKLETFFLRKFGDSFHQMTSADAKGATYSQAPRFVIECAVLSMLTLGALALQGERIAATNAATLALVSFVALKLLPSINTIFSAAASIKYNRNSLSSLLSLTAEAAAEKQLECRPTTPAETANAFEVRHLSVIGRRDEEGVTRRILSDLSFKIPVHQYVAIVGSSGSGKSTLIDVLAGLSEPNVGSATRLGRPATDRSANLAYVPQRIEILSASLAENVAIGMDRPHIDRDRVRWALEMAALGDLENELSEGIDTLLGSGNRSLSGGQLQRIGIARAFFFLSEVIILDEATSALDAITERQIVDNLMKLRGKTTIVFVTHRESVAGRLDRTIRLEGGVITDDILAPRLVCQP